MWGKLWNVPKGGVVSPDHARFLGASVARHQDIISVCQPFFGKAKYKRGQMVDVDWPGRCFRKNNDDTEWIEIEGAGKKHPMIGLSGIQVNDDFTLFPEPNSDFGQGAAQVAVSSCEDDSNSLANENCFFKTTSLTRFAADVFNRTNQREWDNIFESYNNIEKDCKDSSQYKFCTINDKIKKKAYIRSGFKIMPHNLCIADVTSGTVHHHLERLGHFRIFLKI